MYLFFIFFFRYVNLSMIYLEPFIIRMNFPVLLTKKCMVNIHIFYKQFYFTILYRCYFATVFEKIEKVVCTMVKTHGFSPFGPKLYFGAKLYFITTKEKMLSNCQMLIITSMLIIYLVRGSVFVCLAFEKF